MESFEKGREEKAKDKLQNHAEEYLNRIRSFQNGLLTWAVTWNIAFMGGLFYLIEKRNVTFFNKIICYYPFITLFFNICFLVMYFKHSWTAEEIVKNYLPDFKTEYCVIKKLPKNRTLLLLMILVIQVIIFALVFN